jgi:hypothetical protein
MVMVATWQPGSCLVLLASCTAGCAATMAHMQGGDRRVGTGTVRDLGPCQPASS